MTNNTLSDQVVTPEKMKEVYEQFKEHHGDEVVFPKDIIMFCAPIFFELGKEAGQWVSVEERLPNENQEVMVYASDHGTVMLTRFIAGDFALARVGPMNGFEKHGVTHWQAIQPPKPGSE